MSNPERIALFIDGANLYASAKSLGFDIDYKRLLKEFQGKGRLIRAFYYTALVDDQEYSSIRPLVDWLDYNGYAVVTKPTKEFVDSTGRRKVKGNMDIELAVTNGELASKTHEAPPETGMFCATPSRSQAARALRATSARGPSQAGTT